MAHFQCFQLVGTVAPGPWRLTFALGRLENLIFSHTNHMLGTLDFTILEHWAPFNFPYSTALVFVTKEMFYLDFYVFKF